MSAEDWTRDEQQVRAHRCEIAEYETGVFTAYAPKCGRRATWWSDDVSEGSTTWMCDEHCREVLSQCREDAEATEIDP